MNNRRDRTEIIALILESANMNKLNKNKKGNDGYCNSQWDYLKDGKIVEHWEGQDYLGLMQELGAIPKWGAWCLTINLKVFSMMLTILACICIVFNLTW